MSSAQSLRAGFGHRRDTWPVFGRTRISLGVIFSNMAPFGPSLSRERFARSWSWPLTPATIRWAPHSARDRSVKALGLGWDGQPQGLGMWLWVKTNRIPFWGRCTTHFRTYFRGAWDVHWGLTGISTHGQQLCGLGWGRWHAGGASQRVTVAGGKC